MRRSSSKAATGLLLAAALSLGSGICFAAEGADGGQPPVPDSSNLYVKVQLNQPLKLSKLKPGDVVEGKLARDVYSSDRELFPAASNVRLTVDHMEKRRRARNDHWPWVVNAFTPRHEPYPVFKTAMISGANGESALQVSLIAISRKREVQAQARKKKSGKSSDEAGAVEVSKTGGVYGSGKLATPIMTLEASYTEPEKPSVANEAAPSSRADLSGLGRFRQARHARFFCWAM